MKKLFLFLGVLAMAFTLTAAKDKNERRKEKREAFMRRQTRQAKIPAGWSTSLEEGIKAAKKNNLPIMVVITSTRSYNNSRTLDRKVIQIPDFQTEIKQYAAVVYLDYPKNCSDEKILADVKKCTFFQERIPCIAVVDAEMNVLALPKSFTRQGIVAAARQAARKIQKDSLKRSRSEAEAADEDDGGKKPKEKAAEKEKEKKTEKTEKSAKSGDQEKKEPASGDAD